MEISNNVIIVGILLVVILIAAVVYLVLSPAQTIDVQDTNQTEGVTESDEFGEFDTSVLDEIDASAAPSLPE